MLKLIKGSESLNKNNKIPPKLKFWLKRENLAIIEGWARNGLTDSDIAHNMGIAKSTLCEYKKKSNELSDALKKNKDIADIIIENALYNKAKNGDVTAMIFWLKNRRMQKWRDKPIEEIKTDGGGIVLISEAQDGQE